MLRSYIPRKYRPWVTLLLIIITVLLWFGQQQGWLYYSGNVAMTNQPGLYQVTKFVDGDTIQVDMNGTPERIRFIGVDTPETHKPNAPVQCYGPEASAYTKKQIGTQRVRLEADSLSTNRDRYKRLLRYVYLPDGTNINQEIIQGGYGFYYPYFPFTKSTAFSQAGKHARENKQGLWRSCTPTATDEGGYISNDLLIPQM